MYLQHSILFKTPLRVVYWTVALNSFSDNCQVVWRHYHPVIPDEVSEVDGRRANEQRRSYFGGHVEAFRQFYTRWTSLFYSRLRPVAVFIRGQKPQPVQLGCGQRLPGHKQLADSWTGWDYFTAAAKRSSCWLEDGRLLFLCWQWQMYVIYTCVLS